MCRVLAIVILLAAVVSSPRLEAQMHATQRPGVHARMGVGPRASVVRPAPRFGVMGTRPFARPSALVGRGPFRHHLRSQVFFGNSGLSEQEPITEEELPFEELAETPFEERAEELTEQLVPGTMFLSYPVDAAPYYSEPYYQGAEQTAASVSDRESDLFRENRPASG
jgi:hypothetical protein